jgi:hypothetical protein
MQKQDELLLALGFTQADLDKFSDESIDITPFVDSFRAKQKELFTNDPEIVKPIQAAERAKIQASHETKIKRLFDLTPEEVKEKTFDQIVELAKEKVGNSKSKTTDEIQLQLVEANKKIKQYEEEIIPAKEQEKEDFKKQYVIKDKLTKKIASMPLSIDPEAAMMILEAQLAKSNKLELDENGDLVILDKEGNKPMNETRTKIFTIDEILDSTASKYKIKKESNAGETATTKTAATATTISGTNAKGTFKNPHLAAAQENAQKLAEKAA